MGRRPWPRHHRAPKVLVADEWPGRRITAPIVPVAHEPPDNPNSQKIGKEENEPAPSVQVRPLVLRIGLEEYDPARDLAPPDCPQRMVPVEPVLMEIVIELPRREADGLNSKVSAADDGVAQPVRKLIVRHEARGQPPNGPCKFLSSAPIYQERFPTSPANVIAFSGPAQPGPLQRAVGRLRVLLEPDVASLDPDGFVLVLLPGLVLRVERDNESHGRAGRRFEAAGPRWACSTGVSVPRRPAGERGTTIMSGSHVARLHQIGVSTAALRLQGRPDMGNPAVAFAAGLLLSACTGLWTDQAGSTGGGGAGGPPPATGAGGAAENVGGAGGDAGAAGGAGGAGVAGGAGGAAGDVGGAGGVAGVGGAAGNVSDAGGAPGDAGGAGGREIWNGDSVRIAFTLNNLFGQLICGFSATRDQLTEAQLVGLSALRLHDSVTRLGCDISTYSVTIHSRDGSALTYRATEDGCSTSSILLFQEFNAWAKSTTCSQ